MVTEEDEEKVEVSVGAARRGPTAPETPFHFSFTALDF